MKKLKSVTDQFAQSSILSRWKSQKYNQVCWLPQYLFSMSEFSFVSFTYLFIIIIFLIFY